MYEKSVNFFKSVSDLNTLTRGSNYFTVGGCDVALTKNQNLFIKLPKSLYKTDTTQKSVDKVIGYLIVEGFLPKTLSNKKVNVWVYN